MRDRCWPPRGARGRRTEGPERRRVGRVRRGSSRRLAPPGGTYNRGVLRRHAVSRGPRFAAPVLAVAALAVPALLAGPTSAGATDACGSATGATLAAVDSTVVDDVYANELSGSEVSSDLAHVTDDADLISAVVGGSSAPVLESCFRLFPSTTNRVRCAYWRSPCRRMISNSSRWSFLFSFACPAQHTRRWRRRRRLRIRPWLPWMRI